MIKVFISQPMHNLTDEEILKDREEMKEEIRELIGNNFLIIDSFLKDYKTPSMVTKNNVPVNYLGKSIEFLSFADVVYFGKGWEDARGCKIEHEIALQYGIKIIKD